MHPYRTAARGHSRDAEATCWAWDELAFGVAFAIVGALGLAVGIVHASATWEPGLGIVLLPVGVKMILGAREAPSDSA